jgi:ABC-type phosphate transport system ATPase subunit
VIKSSDSTQTTFTRLIGYIEDIKTLSGKAILFNGNEVKWSANKTAPFVKPIDSLKVQKNNTVMPTTYPNVAFGTAKQSTAETLLFKNATVWTNEKEGILEETDVLVKNGKFLLSVKYFRRFCYCS